MNKLLQTVIWDLRIQARYQIVTVVCIVTILYIAIFKLLPFENIDKFIVLMIFNDPVILGFIFTAALVLFEKDDNTLEALVVTPMKVWQYLWSKAISLTLLALGSGFAMALAGHGLSFNFIGLFLAVSLSSVLFIFISFAAVAKFKTINSFLVSAVFYMVLFASPMLNFFEITTGTLAEYPLYIFPTQASLILFEWAFGGVSGWKLVYAFVYLLGGIWGAYTLANRAFNKYILQ